ncbi:GMC oxidoreductase [Thioalkalivibrio sp. XN8]|uniref:GMC oxidoreductase n=1 Tax=Thioalkalivibrio sp. XN8 TaxID=2712863 RepID=UPI0013EAF84B|nr:GMC oxidoreductase [Thioalkalivibrio sp. XN8]NGP54112.1 GMC family oxidoreductase [Thioalkalivibrio sp. XN8]
MARVHEVLVIGSGFGGSVAAARLAEAGVDVALLERGPWRDTLPVQSMGIGNRIRYPAGAQLYSRGLRAVHGRWLPRQGLGLSRYGLFELHAAGDVTTLCASSVGGGSHVYTALNDRPRVPDYWDGHHPEVSNAALEPHYQRVMEEMGGRPPRLEDAIPNLTAQRYRESPLFDATETLERPRHAVQFPATPGTSREIEWGEGIRRREADWKDGGLLGSRFGTKTTLDFAYLAPAMRRGLRVLDLHEAISVHRCRQTHAARYCVQTRNLYTGRIEPLYAEHVMLAAGTMNTLRLLLSSRDEARGLDGMPALGQRFGTNGDAVGWWSIQDPEADFSRGLPCHGVMAPREGRREDDPLLIEVGLVGIAGMPLPAPLKRKLRRSVMLLAMGADRADGRARLERGRLRVRYDRDASPVFGRAEALFKQVGELSGRKVRVRRKPFTVHPLGGAVLGATETDGVVDAAGEVHGFPGLFVVDAAALPAAPGGPPSMTIAAWSSWVAARFLERRA